MVVVKEAGIKREDSRESALTEDNGASGPGPTPTAHTSLGIKVFLPRLIISIDSASYKKLF